MINLEYFTKTRTNFKQCAVKFGKYSIFSPGCLFSYSKDVPNDIHAEIRKKDLCLIMIKSIACFCRLLFY